MRTDRTIISLSDSQTGLTEYVNTRHNSGILAASIIFMLAANAIAGPPAFTLARFAQGDQHLQHIIKFPAGEGDLVVIIYCIADVLRSGGIRENWCLPSSNDERTYRKAVEVAAKHADVKPALVDGVPHAVYLYYRVVFVRDGDNSMIGVYPNWGNDLDRYGIDYQAPQRYTPTIYPSDCTVLGAEYSVLATMLIDSGGKVSGDVSFDPEPVHWKRRLCTRKIRSIHESARYLPGRQDGKVIEASYVEAWGFFDYLVAE